MKSYTKEEKQLINELVEIMGEDYDDSTLTREIIFESAFLDLDTKEMFVFVNRLDLITFYALSGIASVYNFYIIYEYDDEYDDQHRYYMNGFSLN